MMTKEQRIEMLLELQEHPEQLTDEQLQQIFADDEMRRLVQQLGFTKRAFKCQALQDDTPDIDGEWEAFATSYAEELAALDTDIAKPAKSSKIFTLHTPLQKIAASFVSVLIASGFAFAAIHIVRQNTRPQTPISTASEALQQPQRQTIVAANTIKTDAIPVEAHIFNNVPLDSMLSEIASAYQVQVAFENETARHLRFHFVWKREDSLARVVEKLNTFEAVNIRVENKTLVVR